MERGNESAFPRPEAAGIEAQDGLTKREYFAAKAMQSFLTATNGQVDMIRHDIAKSSVLMADALLKELEK